MQEATPCHQVLPPSIEVVWTEALGSNHLFVHPAYFLKGLYGVGIKSKDIVQ